MLWKLEKERNYPAFLTHDAWMSVEIFLLDLHCAGITMKRRSRGRARREARSSCVKEEGQVTA